MVLTVSSSNINKTINKKVKYNLKFYHTRKRENCYTSTHIMYIIWIYMELCSIYCAVDIAEFWKKFQSWTSEVLWVIWEPGKSAGWGRILVPLALECFWCYQLHHTLFISVTGTWNSSPRDHNSWVAREEKTRLLTSYHDSGFLLQNSVRVPSEQSDRSHPCLGIRVLPLRAAFKAGYSDPPERAGHEAAFAQLLYSCAVPWGRDSVLILMS